MSSDMYQMWAANQVTGFCAEGKTMNSWVLWEEDF